METTTFLNEQDSVRLQNITGQIVSSPESHSWPLKHCEMEAKLICIQSKTFGFYLMELTAVDSDR